MTTRNLRINEDNGSTKILCSSYTDKNALKDFLISRCDKIKDIFDNIFDFPFKEEFEIVINDYEGIILMVFKSSSNNIKYYLFDDDIRYLSVTDDISIVFKSRNVTITNDSLYDENNTKLLVSFINYLGELKNIIPFNIEQNLLSTSLRIFNDKFSKIIIEDEDIILTLPYFYKETLHKLSMYIVSKKGLRIVGSIDCVFNDLGIDNFAYRGNVMINIYPESINLDYDLKALRLLKTYVDNSKEKVNKDMFLACSYDDEDTSRIAETEGKLVYEGYVPKSDPLNFIGKVKNVRVYRIGDKHE